MFPYQRTGVVEVRIRQWITILRRRYGGIVLTAFGDKEAGHRQHDRAFHLAPVLAVSTIIFSPFAVPDRATSQWAMLEGMLQLLGGPVLAVAGVRCTPLLGDLRTVYTPADNPEHAVPFRLWQCPGIVSTMLEPGTACNDGLYRCWWEVAITRRRRVGIFNGREPERVCNIGGVRGDGVLMQNGHRLGRPAFVVQCASRPQDSREVGR